MDERPAADFRQILSEFSKKSVPLHERYWFFPILFFLFGMVFFLAVYMYFAKRKLAMRTSQLEEIVRRRTALLQESEERYRNIIDNTLIGLFRTTLSGKILMANPAFIEMLGYDSMEELSEINISEQLYFKKESRDQFIRMLKNKDFVNNFETTWIKKDGSPIHIRKSARLIRDESGNPTHYECTIEDNTERKQMEKALVETQSLLAAAIDSSPAGIIIIDAPDGRIRMINTAVLGMISHIHFPVMNQRLKDLLQENPSFRDDGSLITEEDSSIVRTLFEGNVIRNKKIYMFRDGEKRCLLSNAAPVYDGRGDIVAGILLIHDITELKNTSDALHQSEERFRSVIEASNDAMIEINSGGLITLFNKAAEKIFGYSREEVLGSSISCIIPEKYRESHEHYIHEFFDAGIQPRVIHQIHELEAVRKNGEKFHIDISLSLGSSGQEPFILVVIRDISRRKSLEEQLRQSQKMEAIGNLAGGVAHDFNNLLTGMLGYSELMLARTPKDDPNYQSLFQIKKASESAASLTQQLLAFSRKQILEPIALNLNELIASMDKMLRRLIFEDIELVVTMDPALGYIQADPVQIEQILLNLAVNARDAMPSGGSLTIETANKDVLECSLENHPEIQPGRYVMLSVKDTGHGMDQKVLERIFDPFYTTKEIGKGTGLGLSTVYGIVKQSNGHIFASSEINQGAAFNIYFPKIEQGAQSPSSKADVDSLAGSEVVLVVEDEEIVKNMIINIFENQGYTILTASNHREAVQWVDDYPEEIQLLLSDVILPQMSGPELAKILTARRPGMKVLFMSGYSEDAIAHHGVLNEKVNLIRKPFSPNGILRKVRQVIDARQESLSEQRTGGSALES